MKKILECILQVENVDCHFIFVSDIASGEQNFEEDLPFSNLHVLGVTEDGVFPFEITGTTWAGHKLDDQDALTITLSQYTRGYTKLRVLYMYEPLKAYLDKLIEDCIIIDNQSFPKKIVFGSFGDVYDLAYITDTYTYYCESGDQVLMFDTKSREEIASNYFAEVGLMDSIENVSLGKEKLLYQSEVFSESL